MRGVFNRDLLGMHANSFDLPTYSQMGLPYQKVEWHQIIKNESPWLPDKSLLFFLDAPQKGGYPKGLARGKGNNRSSIVVFLYYILYLIFYSKAERYSSVLPVKDMSSQWGVICTKMLGDLSWQKFTSTRGFFFKIPNSLLRLHY